MQFTQTDPNTGGRDVTKEQEKATIAALLHERSGYENRARKAEEDGNDEAKADAEDRVSQVNAELKKLGHTAQTGQQRAARRPANKDTETR